MTLASSHSPMPEAGPPPRFDVVTDQSDHELERDPNAVSGVGEIEATVADVDEQVFMQLAIKAMRADRLAMGRGLASEGGDTKGPEYNHKPITPRDPDPFAGGYRSGDYRFMPPVDGPDRNRRDVK